MSKIIGNRLLFLEFCLFWKLCGRKIGGSRKFLFSKARRKKDLRKFCNLARKNGIPFQNIRAKIFQVLLKIERIIKALIAFTASADYFDADKLIEEITKKKNLLSVILDGVEDPRNLGAILRVVECAGADGVFIPERRAVGLTETVAKSSAGATEYVKVAKVTNINRFD